MFCSACGDQVGYLTGKGAEIVSSAEAVPTNSMAVRDHTLTGFTTVCPWWTMSTVSSTADYGACTSTTHHDTRALFSTT